MSEPCEFCDTETDNDGTRISVYAEGDGDYVLFVKFYRAPGGCAVRKGKEVSVCASCRIEILEKVVEQKKELVD